MSVNLDSILLSLNLSKWQMTFWTSDQQSTPTDFLSLCYMTLHCYSTSIHSPLYLTILFFAMMDSGWTFVVKPYSGAWRWHCRIFVQHLNPTSAEVFFDKQTASTHTLLRLLLHDLKRLEAHIISDMPPPISSWVLLTGMISNLWTTPLLNAQSG
jgi:hypothetical protein